MLKKIIFFYILINFNFLKMTNNCDCEICRTNDYETRWLNLYELKIYINNNLKYLDRRHNYLTLYNFCPFCGQKINWKQIKKVFIKGEKLLEEDNK